MIIHLLDSDTIDKIAAGEVVERPASVVKELVENAIDAGAKKVTVEIKDGGISLIRVTDDGCGIDKEDIPNAFLRHATSKIRHVEDLKDHYSLGFRGEALSSISAVSHLEMITKRGEDLMGTRAICEGGVLKETESVGAPDGTTILMRNLFYNTPPRKKFLKSPQTEGSYIADLMQHIALSHPEIALTFIQNSQTRFFTSGNNDLLEVIYRIYGKEVSELMLPFSLKEERYEVKGYIGKSQMSRSTRGFELFFVNGRYIKSKVLSTAVEEGYKRYLMQHKYPFCVLHITIDGSDIDVNVHPSKLEVKFFDPVAMSRQICDAVSDRLHEAMLMPDYKDEGEEENAKKEERKAIAAVRVPEPFETQRAKPFFSSGLLASSNFHVTDSFAPTDSEKTKQAPYDDGELFDCEADDKKTENEKISQETPVITTKARQMELFTDALLNPQEKKEAEFKIVGQLFETYWVMEYQDDLYFIDQHAAAEKVNFERWMERLRNKENCTQELLPPIIVTLTNQEQNILSEYADYFTKLGFEFEDFGGNEVSLRGVPLDLYGSDEKNMFLTVLDELSESPIRKDPDLITDKLASMSCKAAIKGNEKISYEEIRQLLKTLFTLENPYHCPHGRPTMFRMSREDLEKKFKRIV